jgi:isocitrate dehydrogenase
VDVFLHWWDATPDDLGAMLSKLAGPELSLQMIANREVKVFPDGLPETFCTDHPHGRFVAAPGSDDAVQPAELHSLLSRLVDAGYDVVKSENLYTFDGLPGFSLGQGQ